MSILKGDRFDARLEGVRVASTFTGFCGRHDTELFRPLETQEFGGTPEQCLLLAYRAVCRELYAKQGTLALADTLRELDRGRDSEVQREVQSRIGGVLTGSSLAVQDLTGLKAAMEAYIFGRDFGSVHGHVILLDCVPEFMASAMLNPEYDFQGRRLQDLGPASDVDWLSFSLIATDTGGAVVFTWLGENRVAEQLVNSLDTVADADVGHAIVRFTFEMTENVYASPVWWEGLSADERSQLLRRMRTGGVPFREPTALLDDGLRLVRWPVNSRRSL